MPAWIDFMHGKVFTSCASQDYPISFIISLGMGTTLQCGALAFGLKNVLCNEYAPTLV
jgi:hypothetical protein